MAPSEGGGGADAGDTAPSEGGTDVAVDGPAGDGGTAVMRSFYTHPTYPAGVIRPNKPQPMLDGAVTAIYTGWKKFVINGCGGSYVKAGADIGMNLATVSELQGMGMVITVILAGHDENARTIFDGMFRVARAHKSNNNMALMSKEVRQTGTNCANATMPESQTDGDLDIATALLMADKQWGSGGTVNYAMEARNMIAAIKMNDVNAMSKLPLLGDWVSVNDQKFYWGTRTADFIPGHLRAFGGATSDTFWMQSVDAIYGLVAKIQMVNSATTGLLPDFVMNLNTNGVPATANWSGAGNPNDGQFFYHAARTPLRLVADYISSGGSEARAKAALAKMNAWIRMKTTENPAMIIDGYNITTRGQHRQRADGGVRGAVRGRRGGGRRQPGLGGRHLEPDQRRRRGQRQPGREHPPDVAAGDVRPLVGAVAEFSSSKMSADLAGGVRSRSRPDGRPGRRCARPVQRRTARPPTIRRPLAAKGRGEPLDATRRPRLAAMPPAGSAPASLRDRRTRCCRS